jgi:hypothetical protein
VQLATIQELARYWVTEYDWRACEAKLNALPQFATEIDAVDVHFIHVKSPHPGALPLIMTHGWPGSVIELLETIGPLTDPAAHGGQAEDAFDLVLPSLPGYGFSGEPAEVGWDPGRIAQTRARSSGRRAAGRRSPTRTSPTSTRPNGVATSPPGKNPSCSQPRSGLHSSRCTNENPHLGLALKASADTPARRQGPGRSLPGPDAASWRLHPIFQASAG